MLRSDTVNYVAATKLTAVKHKRDSFPEQDLGGKESQEKQRLHEVWSWCKLLARFPDPYIYINTKRTDIYVLVNVYDK